MMYRLYGTVALLCLLLSGCGGDTGDIAESGRLSNAAPAEKGEPGADFCADQSTEFSVTGFSPDRKSQNISVDRREFLISFNASIDPDSVNDTSVVISPKTSSQAISSVVNVDGSQLIVTLSENLLFDTSYLIEVGEGVRANCPRGEVKTAESRESDFRTATDKRPRIVRTSPTAGDTRVSPDSDFVIEFNQPVTVGEGAVEIVKLDAAGMPVGDPLVCEEKVTNTRTMNSSERVGDMVTLFNCQPELEEGASYQLSVFADKIESENGEFVSDQEGDNFTARFVVGTNFPPSITMVTPDQQLASLDRSIVIDFSEEIEFVGERDVAIFLSDGANTVNTQISLRPAQIILDPLGNDPDGNNLKPNTQYTVTVVADQIQDFGNDVDNDGRGDGDNKKTLAATDRQKSDGTFNAGIFQFIFTTARDNSKDSKQVLSVSPSGIQFGAEPTSDIVIVVEGQLTFDKDKLPITIYKAEQDGTPEADSTPEVDSGDDMPPKLKDQLTISGDYESLYDEETDRTTVTISFSSREGRFENSSYYVFDLNTGDSKDEDFDSVNLRLNGKEFCDHEKRDESQSVEKDCSRPELGSNIDDASNDKSDLLDQLFRVRSTVVALDTDVLRLFENSPLAMLETGVNEVFNFLYRDSILTGDLLGDAVDGGGILKAVVLEIPLTTPLTTDTTGLPLDGDVTELLNRDSVVAICNPYLDKDACVLELNVNLDSSGVLTNENSGLVTDVTEKDDELGISLRVLEDGATQTLLTSSLDGSILTGDPSGTVDNGLVGVLQFVVDSVVGAGVGALPGDTSEGLVDITALRGSAVTVSALGQEVVSVLELDNRDLPKLIEVFNTGIEAAPATPTP